MKESEKRMLEKFSNNNLNNKKQKLENSSDFYISNITFINIKIYIVDNELEDNKEEYKTVVDVVTPWYNIPYERQLAMKEDEMRRVLIKIIRSLKKEYLKKCKYFTLIIEVFPIFKLNKTIQLN